MRRVAVFHSPCRKGRGGAAGLCGRCIGSPERIQLYFQKAPRGGQIGRRLVGHTFCTGMDGGPRKLKLGENNTVHFDTNWGGMESRRGLPNEALPSASCSSTGHPTPFHAARTPPPRHTHGVCVCTTFHFLRMSVSNTNSCTLWSGRGNGKDCDF